MSQQSFSCRDRDACRQGQFWVATWFLVSQQRRLQFETEVCCDTNFYVATGIELLARLVSRPACVTRRLMRATARSMGPQCLQQHAQCARIVHTT